AEDAGAGPPGRSGRRRRPGRGGSGRGAGDEADRPAPAGEAPAPRRSRERGPRTAPDEDLVVVRFKGQRKGYYHNRSQVALSAGQYCLVEADRGRDLGRVTYVGRGPAAWWAQAERQGVLAAASPTDLARLQESRGDEWGFRDLAAGKIAARGLEMTLVGVERQFDHRKITFYFTAEQRVDFRELVRDLAAVFRTRIELRQIGVRDEARHKGGLGVCGREFCCSSFMHEFLPVTLKMAKVQQLPLNPGKLSGPCGRLRCCLTFEHEVYQDLRRSLPRVGARVATPRGEGTVRKLDLLRESVAVALPDQAGLVPFRLADLAWEGDQELPAPRPGDPRRDGCAGGGCGGCGAAQGDDPDGDGGGE
ncbi:MAG: stage 0 sporulation family protein, partial [Candidatus Krumholzibacteriia bacterium]